MQAIIGIFAILGIGFLLCKDRSMIQWRFIAIGLILQFALATLFLKVAWTAESLMIFNTIVTAIEQALELGDGTLDIERDVLRKHGLNGDVLFEELEGA